MFMTNLRAWEGSGAKALEWPLLTVLRTSEVIGARWHEFDLQRKIWTVPAERMKAKREHRVPLSDRAIAILTNLPRDDDFLFPGERSGKSLSNMAMLATLKRLGHNDLTVHGFRSTFRDWAAERTNFQNHVVEMLLAHTIGNKVEAAYRRGDLFEKRVALMDAWAEYTTMRSPACRRLPPSPGRPRRARRGSSGPAPGPATWPSCPASASRHGSRSRAAWRDRRGA